MILPTFYKTAKHTSDKSELEIKYHITYENCEATDGIIVEKNNQLILYYEDEISKLFKYNKIKNANYYNNKINFSNDVTRAC